MPLKRLLPKSFEPHDGLEHMGSPHLRELPQRFRAVVWNVYKGRRSGWLEDLAALAADAHLLLLQEAVLHETSSDYFHTSERHEWVMARSFASELRQEVTGVKTGGVVPAVDAHVYFSPSREPVVRTPKLILVTRYPMEGGGNLLAVNAHAVNFVSTAKFGEQLSQMHEVIAEHDGPVLLGGDFNTWSRSRKDVLLALIRDLNLEEVPFGNRNNRGKLRHMGRFLDHVFGRGLTALAAAELSEIGTSDHHPLSVEFELRNDGG